MNPSALVQRTFGLAVALGLGFGGVSASFAQDWLNWRGPNYDGSAPDQSVAVKFSKTEGLSWTAPLPGPAAATPVVAGNRVFLSTTDAANRALVALAFDRKTGKELWRHQVAEGDHRDERSNYASSSPVTDGKHVWFFYGQGDLVAFTVGGQEVWRRNLQKDFGAFAYQWTPATSPLLHDGRLYVQVLQRDVPVQGRGRTDGPIESYLLAVDPATGKDVWRHVRPSEAAAESHEAYSTPIPARMGDRMELLITGGDCITGHDPATGKELWRWGTWNPARIGHWRLVPSPVVGGGVALACGPKGSAVYAIKAGAKGTLPQDGFTWQSAERDVSTDVSTPLFYRGRFFILNSDKKSLFCVEPANGKVVWKGELPSRSKIEASPLGVDGRIYVMNHSGEVFVLGAGDQFEILHSTAMGEEGDRDLRASVVAAHGQLFFRTAKALFAVGPKS